MRLGKPTMRFHVFPRSWQGYQDSCHWVHSEPNGHHATRLSLNLLLMVLVASSCLDVCFAISVYYPLICCMLFVLARELSVNACYHGNGNSIGLFVGIIFRGY